MGKIGIIGGSGLYDMEHLKHKKFKEVKTPFGVPSDEFLLAKLEGKDVVFLPRHGKGHRISPSQINYRANIYGMKSLGVDRIIALAACGSLKENIKPLDFVIPTQFIDRTNQARRSTFFDKEVVVHVNFAHPVCEDLSRLVSDVARATAATVHFGGTYLNIEGPQFSTLAESNLYRSWGLDVIGMTNATEAKLAREAEICYVTLAAVSDYDCWREEVETVSVDIILSNLTKSISKAKEILQKAIPLIGEEKTCGCAEALKYSIATNPGMISKKTKKELSLLIGKYIK